MLRLMLLAGLAAALPAAAEPLAFTGVNLAGGEFGKVTPGVRPVYAKNFIYPNKGEIDYFTAQGMNVFRYPFRWEVLQPDLQKPLVAEEVARLKASVELATGRGCVVLLDPHNYARHYGKVVGSPEVSSADFSDFWRRLATEFKGNPHVWFGLVNEPHGISAKQWFEVAAPAVLAIRETGAKNLILVPGTAYSGAHSWTASWYGGANADQVSLVKDPIDHWAIEVHQYLDSDSSGTKPEVAGPDVGGKRLAGFVKWCREHKRRAFLGEFGVPATALGEQALKEMLDSVQRDGDVWLGWAWWAAGAWWGNYMFSIEPGKDGTEKPQMPWLRPYLHGAGMPEIRVTVEGGEGSGGVKPCAKHPIRAGKAPAGMVFDRWAGDTVWLEDPRAAQTTLTMPFKEIRVSAQFRRAGSTR